MNLNFKLVEAKVGPKSALGQISFALLFFLAELFLFITHKSIVSLVVLHLWLPSSWIAFVFRPFDASVEFRISLTMPCQVYGEVLELSLLSCPDCLPWICETCRVWIWKHPLLWPAHKNIRPLPSSFILDEAVTLTFSCCEVSASRMLQVPESYSLNFFKNFFCCRFSENFSCLTVK